MIESDVFLRNIFGGNVNVHLFFGNFRLSMRTLFFWGIGKTGMGTFFLLWNSGENYEKDLFCRQFSGIDDYPFLRNWQNWHGDLFFWRNLWENWDEQHFRGNFRGNFNE